MALRNETEIVKLQQALITDVNTRVSEMLTDKTLRLPPNYAHETAIRFAMLKLQTVTDKNKNPALAVCTKTSLFTALLTMVCMGLRPQADQVYFIVHGNQLTCRRSYFGTIHVATTYGGAERVFASVVYAKDTFKYTINNGSPQIVLHEQELVNRVPDQIIGAYCVVTFKDGPPETTVLSIDEIRQSWKMGGADASRANGPHSQKPDQMALRTVINLGCKRLVNAASDRYLLLGDDEDTPEDSLADEQAGQLIEQREAEIIDIDIPPAVEDPTSDEETTEPKAPPAAQVTPIKPPPDKQTAPPEDENPFFS